MLLKRADFVRMGQGHVDMIQSMEQLVLERLLQFKLNHLALRCRDRLDLKVNREVITVHRFDFPKQAVDRISIQHDGEKGVFYGIAMEDIGNAGRQQHPYPMFK